MSFVGRHFAGTLLIVCLVIGTLVIRADVQLRRDLETEIRASLEREALLTAQTLSTDSLQWQPLIARMGASTGLRFTLVDQTGRVRAESELPAGGITSMENHASRPEIVAALNGGPGSDRRVSPTLGVTYLYVAVPGGPGAVRVASSLTRVDDIVRQAQRALLGPAALALLLGAILALLAGRHLAAPITAVTQAARAIARGTPPRFPHSDIPDIESLIGAVREMHEQLERRFDELRGGRAESAALFEAMAEGVLAADREGSITTANGAARRLLGYGPAEVLPPIEQLFRVKPAREAVMEARRGRPVVERELDLDGHTVRLSAQPLPEGGALLVLHDITDLRRLEAVRRDFVANVSHELKTPLTSISGYAETLLHDSPDPETTTRFLQTILTNARRMQRLVDGLLDLGRIESGVWRPAPEELDVGAIARESWGLLADRAAKQSVSFDLRVADDAGQFRADPEALRQVLSNLFDNALRHTPAGGRIVCAATLAEGGHLLAVSDTGSGVAAEHLPRIFERFYRADAGRGRDTGGTGLGLAIVKHLVEAHGGRVGAASTVGRGTEVSCWFPEADTEL